MMARDLIGDSRLGEVPGERASERTSTSASEIVRLRESGVSLGGRVRDEPTRHVHHGELLGFQIAQYLFDDLPREHAKVSRDVRDVVVVQRMQRRRRRRRAALDRGIDGIADGVDESFVLDGRKLPLSALPPGLDAWDWGAWAVRSIVG